MKKTLLFFLSALCLPYVLFSGESKNRYTLRGNGILPCRGRVAYSKTVSVSFESKGRIAYVAPVGTVAESDIYNPKGLVAVPGTLLAKQDTSLAENSLQLAEVRVRETSVVLSEKERTFRRDRGLYAKKAVSEKKFLESQLYYDTSVIDSKRAKIELEKCRYVLDACFVRAPFPGIVEEVYQRPGAAVDVAHRVLKFSALSPAKIEITLPESVTRTLDQTVQILLYPVDSEKGVAAWFGVDGVRASSLECYADNPLVPVGTLTEEEKRLPEVGGLFPIPKRTVSADRDLLWIEPAALKRASDGTHFVWKLAGAFACVVGKMPKRTDILEKIPVEPAGLEFSDGAYVKLCGIRPNPKLKIHDVLAESVPENVKNRDRVVYRMRKYMFLPGEEIRVEIVFPSDLCTGFFVPAKAVSKSEITGEGFVRILPPGESPENARREKVTLRSGENGAFFRIESPALSEGTVLLY